MQLSSSAAHNEHDDRYSLLCGNKNTTTTLYIHIFFKTIKNYCTYPFVMVGAMSHKYSAQLVSAIDPRITNRHIVIAGGVGTLTSQSGQGLR